MTAKERARMARIEAENAELRQRLDQSMAVYRAQAIELIELRSRIEAVRFALDDQERTV